MLKISKEELITAFKQLDLNKGDIVLLTSNISSEDLHLSQKRVVIKTLKEFLGEDGSIIMDLSGGNADISSLNDIEKLADISEARDLMPAYSNETAYLYANDNLALSLLMEDDVVISASASYPYIGIGKYAKLIINGQSIDFPNGNMSPLARLYELRAKVLMLNHNLFDLNLNRYIFETTHKTPISVNGGTKLKDDERIWLKFLEKSIDEDKIKEIIKTSNYKKLFYFTDLNKLTLLSCGVRSYVDYCRKYI